MHLMKPVRRIVLVRPPYSLVYKLFGELPKHREVRVPLGLLSLAGSLIRHGYEVHVVDGEPRLESTEALVKKILALDPDVVGVTSTTPEIHLARDLITSLKRCRPGIITVLGGAHASAVPESTLESIPQLDYIVVGEGEDAIVEIVQHLPREQIVKLPPVEDLDSLPFPAKHLVDPADYSYPHPQNGMVVLDAVETSRGCPFNCIFCYHCNGNTTRFKSADRVWAEIRQSQEQFKAQMVMFFDDTFTLNKNRAKTILQGFLEKQIKLKYHCFTRADTLDEEIIRLMREAGFAKLTMGIESGDQSMLDRLNKGIRLEQYAKAYAMVYRAGLETRGSFMIGNPYESWSTVKASIDFARSLDLFRIGVNIATPYPGTKLYDMALAGKGITLVESDWKNFTRWGRSVVRTPEMSARDLEQAQLAFLSAFYSNPKVIRYHMKRFWQGNRAYYYYRPFLWSIARNWKKPWRNCFV